MSENMRFFVFFSHPSFRKQFVNIKQKDEFKYQKKIQIKMETVTKNTSDDIFSTW